MSNTTEKKTDRRLLAEALAEAAWTTLQHDGHEPDNENKELLICRIERELKKAL